MAGPEGWQRAQSEFGEALQGADLQSRETAYEQARLSVGLDLFRAEARLEVDQELARLLLERAVVADRRRRTQFDHENEMARRMRDAIQSENKLAQFKGESLRSVPPLDRITPYVPDPGVAAAQAEYDRVTAERMRVKQEIKALEQALRARFRLPIS